VKKKRINFTPILQVFTTEIYKNIFFCVLQKLLKNALHDSNQMKKKDADVPLQICDAFSSGTHANIL